MRDVFKLLKAVSQKEETSNQRRWVKFRRKFHADLVALRSAGVNVVEFFRNEHLSFWPWWSIPLNVYEILEKWFDEEFHPAVEDLLEEIQSENKTVQFLLLVSGAHKESAPAKTRLRKAWNKRPPICDQNNVPDDLFFNCPWEWRKPEAEEDEPEETVSEEEFNGPGYYEL